MRPKCLVVGLVVALASLVFGQQAFAETSITSSNGGDNVNTKSGDATATNNSTAQVGQSSDGETKTQDATAGEAANVQDGSNDADTSQQATTHSGAAISGQVIGGVSDDDLLINATNSVEDSTAETGESDGSNNADVLVGLVFGDDANSQDATAGEAINVQDGDNDGSLSQDVDSTSGDAVGGQYVGARTYNGRADLVLSNSSEDVDTTSGTSDEDNIGVLETGLFVFGVET